MRVHLRYFASLREALGPSEVLELRDGVLTVGALRQHLLQRSPQHAEALAPARAVRAALNQVMCDSDAALVDGCEVAFFPPVTGG
jgi:molybdopterin synthase sulfur carrier subunit